MVIRAMARWPNVPAVFGWLMLDRRGRWLIRGEPVENPNAVAFIGRNYASDAQGRWNFQNGPQQVFVRLDYTPWVLAAWPDAAGGGLRLQTHTGLAVARPQTAFVDDAGSVLVHTEHGPGVIEGGSLLAVSEALVDAHGAPLADAMLERLVAGALSPTEGIGLRTYEGVIPVETIARASVPARFGFDSDPQPETGRRPS